MKKRIKGIAVTLAGLSLMISLPGNTAYAAESNTSESSINYEGWKNKDGNWYFYDDGLLKTGWLFDNGKWYYLYSDGTMAHDCFIGDYYVDNTGAWIDKFVDNIKSSLSNDDLKGKMRELGYSSMERVINYNSVDNKYSDSYKYAWYDGQKDNPEYAAVNIFDSGDCSILLRKNGTSFDEKLKKIFKWILPNKGEELFNIVKNNPDNKTLDMDGKKITITKFDDSIGITINNSNSY